RGGDRDHRRDWDRDRDHDWDRRGHHRWYGWDDGCWRRPVVYVPVRSRVVLGWGCDDYWYYRPSSGWCRRSYWCDPYDNLIVTSYHPSWRYSWSSWSGFGFRYSSWNDSFALNIGYSPLVVPAYTTCVPAYGSSLLWNRPSVIVGSSRWFPATYVNNTTIIGTGSGVYDPNLNAGLVTGATMSLPAVPAEQETVTDSTELDRAVEAMQAGRYDAAVDWLRAYVRENPSDGKAMRWLSVALLSARNPDDAAAVMRMAYSTDAGLAGDPLNRYELGLNNTELRDLVVRASQYANAHDTGSAWLLVGVLMQSEGRLNLAASMFDKAAAAGCDPAIIDRLKGVAN
ncbi:MAG: tetratricopeptide repeat protein, partial [Phycisphaerales bacterium]